jgi:macrolide transport system ATP-binding/permease protein
MNIIRQNLRFAIRQLLRNPGFTATVVITLALSIGANTAIFSIVNALLLKSLPYPQPDRMGTLFQRTQGPDPADEQRWIDGHQWEQLRDNVPSLTSAVFASLASGANLESGSKQVAYIHNGRVSQHYFDVLGIHTAIGRNFSQAEDAPNGPKAVILSYNFWRSSFNANRKPIGSAIRLKGEPYTVIGILPQNATTPLNADVYTSLQPSPHGEGNGTNFGVIFRLNTGATWQQADSEINRAWAARIAQIESRNPGAKIQFYTVPFQKGVTSELRPQAIALMAAAGFILLIACANLAGLTLVRMGRRLPEIATRLAVGASRWQILHQLWIENLLLACIGGIAGIGIGFLALRGLLSLLPEDFLPVTGIALDYRVLAFTTLLTLFTSVLFGMLPALAARRVDLRSSLASRATSSGHSVRLRQALIAGEVALTVVLLAGSGLLIRTLIHLQTLPPGFNPNGVMTAKASLDDARYKDAAPFQQLMSSSVAAMQRIPGVESAAVALTLPYERTLNDGVLLHDGPQTGKNIGADVVYVTPRFFDVLQMPVLRGRAFTDSDGPNTRPVAIINSAFAQKYFPDLNPVGLVLDKNALIVGVVSDTQLSSGLNPTAPIQSEETIYIPAAQVVAPMLMVHAWFQPSWIVRTSAPVDGLTEQMQRALFSAAPGVPFSGFYRMSDLQAKALSTQRIEVALLSVMAGLALLLSAIGIFALVASLVTQRTRDIGIRIALGSTIRQAITRISGSGIRATGAGLVIGLAMCAVVLPVMRSVVYGVSVYDVPSLAAVIATLALVSLFAATVPALKIARIDPAKTLREE